MKYTYLIGALLLFSASCNVLDVEPQSSIPANEAFKNKSGITRGINGAYSSLQSLSYYGRSYGIFADLAADNLVHPPNATSVSYAEIDNNSILPENESVDGIWTAIYDGINVANNVIVQVPNMTDMTAAEKNAALGELYFLRALNHFNLLNYFGAIPVKITPTVGVSGINVPRNEVDAVYAQIIQDLAFAAENLPSGSSKIKASANAAKALLARVYLYKKDYSNAARYANEVINSGKYELLADYAAIFASEETAESIFEVDFTPLDKNRIAEYNFPLTLNGRREVAPSDDLIASYGAGDARLASSIAYTSGLPYAIKYNDLSTGSDNVIVLRLSDMYLIRAEANAQLAGDVDAIKSDLNTVRSRAGLAATTAATYADLLTAIEAERRVEFAFEGQRWFDLVRTGRAIDVLPTVTSINQTLFPIPLSEMLTNTNTGMYQNPGY